MKISASIYSDNKRPLKQVIDDLIDHKVDLLHVDCNDDLAVFEDIKNIRRWCQTPIDLHIITETPEKYYDLLRANPVEYVTFQYEQLPKGTNIPQDIPGKKGLAVITPTPVTVFDEYSHFDFILIMATVPGQSGGVFDAFNFSKIRQFRNGFKGKGIHVDGGVNGEVSFILRNMGVTSSVSGSYLFKAPSIGHALMDLTKREMDSHYQIQDFMIPIQEAPVVNEVDIDIEKILQTIESGSMGFCVVVDKVGLFKGIVSNADVRKGFLRHISDFNKLNGQELVNKTPTIVRAEMTVADMMRLINQSTFPISYLPVVDKGGLAVGIITFVNLIKGEI
jgi:ribulose-phosphate 3-epimerase